MALNGGVSTNAYNGRYYTLSWWAAQSISGNYSNINWTLIANGATGSWLAERTLIVDIAGTKVVNKSDRVERYDGTIATGTLKLNHDAAGKKSFSVSVQAAVYGASVNCTGSNTFTLDTIQRGAVITAAPNFNDTDSPTISYTNHAGTKATVLQAGIGFASDSIDIPYRDISKTGTSYTFEFTDEERAKLWGNVKKGTTCTVHFKIKTTVDGNTTYSVLAKTMTLTDAKPVIQPTLEDTSPNSKALTGDSSKIIKGFNHIKYSSNAVGQKGATIASIKVENGGKTYSVDNYYITRTEDNVFRFTVTDSRGNKNTKTVSMPMADYMPITTALEATIELDSEAETTAKAILEVTGNYWTGNFGKQDNALTIKYRYKIGDGEYNEWLTAAADSVTISDTSYNATIEVKGLPYRESCTVQAAANDKVFSFDTKEIVLKTIPVFDWGANDFNFNVPISIEGEPVADFVVETYKDDFWYCEKYLSGKAICYGKKNIGNVACNKAWYSGWYETEQLTMDLPTGLFIENPQFVDIKILFSTAVAHLQMGITPPTKDKLTFAFTRASSANLNNLTPSFYVIGRWR